MAETIAIMDAEGLEKATMRRVAQALDTGPASLYVYVANTAELHGAVLDELLGAILPAAPTAGATPAEVLEHLLNAYGTLLHSHPGLALSALTVRPLGPNALQLYETLFGLLIDSGAPLAHAAWGVDLLLQHITANAAEHTAPSPIAAVAPDEAAAEFSVLAGVIRTADPTRLPLLAAHAEDVLGGTPQERVTWAIRTLVAGITATPTPSTTAPRTEHP